MASHSRKTKQCLRPKSFSSGREPLLPDPDRSGPSTAVIVNGTSYIVDFGTGVVRQAAAARKKGVDCLEAVNLSSVVPCIDPIVAGVSAKHGNC